MLRDSIPNPLRDSVLKISKKLKMSLAGKNSKDMAHWNTPLCSSVENDKIGGDLSFEMMDRAALRDSIPNPALRDSIPGGA